MNALSWVESITAKLTAEFPNRIRFTGLQGSRARGEAHEGSDIDLVVIFDELHADDLARCRSIIEAAPHSNLACGFIGDETTLSRWPRHELFQFYHDTIPVFGSLPHVGEFTVRDAAKAARIGASGIYHAACHAYMFDGESADEILASLFKGAFFTLQALCFARTGSYPRTRAELSGLIEGDEARILEISNDPHAHRPANDEERRGQVDLLIGWAARILAQ